jgi:uncharacterized membrane protein
MWFFIGLIIGIALLALINWIRTKNIQFIWYDWVIGTVALLLGVLAVQHYMTSSIGGEPKAGGLGLLIFGIIALILALVEWQLIVRRRKA